ncbi:putative ribonuclease H protein [Corchorus capsularis]|uniref:Putative ribonuclease H protein n=1 Tax=Corchorus capsularis TaxID=210143 RepID=A0A1R3HEM8_COCAP|nr:putative ribonuclease H protein [Corchorus capsularis]
MCLLLDGIPPLAAMVKINVDSAFDEAGGRAVIRDTNSEVLACAIKKCAFVHDSLFAEAFAIRMGKQFAKDEGFHHCVIESDCLVAISTINRKDAAHSKEA